MTDEKKFVPSDNLSDGINLNIMQSEKDGGIYLNELAKEDVVRVQTKNTPYVLSNFDGSRCNIVGHKTFCPTITQCEIGGSTWGGSMIKVGFIGVGMHMEFYIEGQRITTSEIKTVEKLEPLEKLREQKGSEQ